MQIQTKVTETVKQVKLIREVKWKKATVTFEVDEEFLDVINFFGAVTQSNFVRMGGTTEQYQSVATLWNKVHNNKELRNVLNFDFQRGFTMKPQVQSGQ